MIRFATILATASIAAMTSAAAGTVTVKDRAIIVDFRKEVGPEAVMSLELIKTRRIPEDGKTHGLPPNDGALPTALARNVNQRFVDKKWLDRDVVLAPVSDTQAMWINFTDPTTYGGYHGASANYPFAVMVATGKINAIDGKELQLVLKADTNTKEHNFIVAGPLHDAGFQRWLDGYKDGPTTVRQFVGTSRSSGTSVEEYMTNEVKWGGIQFITAPMKVAAYEKLKAAREAERKRLEAARKNNPGDSNRAAAPRSTVEIDVTAGGKISQVVNFPAFPASDFDMSKAVKFWVTLVDHRAWPYLTGTAAPAPTPDVHNPDPKPSPFANAPGVKPKNAVGQKTDWK